MGLEWKSALESTETYSTNKADKYEPTYASDVDYRNTDGQYYDVKVVAMEMCNHQTAGKYMSFTIEADEVDEGVWLNQIDVFYDEGTTISFTNDVILT